MKIAVFSDSHGDRATLSRIIGLERPDLVIHLGDCARDIDGVILPEGSGLFSVPGNCDFSALPAELTFTLGGKAFLIMHGHTRGVKFGTGRALEAALFRRADVLLFGHTHIPHTGFSKGVLLFNPGSSKKRGPEDTRRGTYGVLRLENGILKPEILPV